MELDRNRRRSLGALAAGGLAAGGLPSARAQAWPSKGIRIFVGFAPGGTTDPYARVYGEYMSTKLGVPVVVENRPGAGGLISLEALARTPGDGYTIGITTSTSVWGSRALYRKLRFDADKDFIPISTFPVGPLVFAVPSTMPVNTVAEWVEHARKTPVTMASYNPASVPHLIAEALNKSHGTRINTVHYKGEGPMWPDVSTGITQAGVGSYVALTPHLQRGTVKVLATVGRERNPKLPDVKSFIAQGFDAQIFQLDGCLLMLAPAGTPADIVTRIGDLFVEAADSPKAVALREAFAIEQKPSNAETAQRRWREESPIWIKLTADMNLTLD